MRLWAILMPFKLILTLRATAKGRYLLRVSGTDSAPFSLHPDIDPDDLTTAELVEAETALYWAVYAEYLVNDWQRKRIHDPEKCDPFEVLRRKRDLATQIICEAFRRINVVDTVYCKNNTRVSSKTSHYCYENDG